MKIQWKAFLVVWLAAASAGAATTNLVPWADAFESYSSGLLLQGTNGWSSSRSDAGCVTNAASQIVELTNTFHSVQAHAYPIPAASHTNVVAVTDLLDNDIHSSSGKVVVVDFTVMPTWCDINPQDNTNLQYAFFIKTNQHVVIWHHRLSPQVTNEWLDLGAGTLVNTGAWTRFTIVQDYSNRMFQIRVNDGDPITHAAGYMTPGGGIQNGSWFYMVQTNSLMSRFTFGDGGINYVDDVVATNRYLAWSGGGFVESVTNDGSIDSASTVSIALRYDTFTGTDSAVFPANRYMVANLPSNLTAVVTQVNSTNLSIRLTGQALTNEAANNVPNLTFTLLDSAFSLGSAANVDGTSNNSLTLTYRNAGRLSYSTNLFQEVPVVNDGSINNIPPLTITLANDLFTGANGEDYATNSAKLSIQGMPLGLTGQVSKLNDTQLQMTLLGKALANTIADSTNFTLVFQAVAFATNPVAANVSNSTMSIAVHYVDSPVLTYASTIFTEKVANDGSVNGTMVTLQHETFAGADGDDLAAAVSAPNLPAGLTVHAIRANSGASVSLVFSNRATAHLSSDSQHNNIIINFNNGAFAGNNAAVVIGSSRSDLSIIFSNQPSLAMPGGLNFTESSQNNGSIANSLPITLTGDTFAADLTGHYAVANVPGGLSAHLTRNNDTQVTLELQNNAAPHTSAQSTNALQLVFADAAFANVAASNINGSVTNFSVMFNDPPSLAYSRTTFTELSFGRIDNNTPLLITLTGDSFAANLSGLFSTSNVPRGLTVSLTRNSASQLTMSLTGIAVSNASTDTIADMGLTFLQGAFANADADQVLHCQANFSVVFMDDTSFVNTVPYEEPFEEYNSGFLLAGTNAWTADYYADAAEVTYDAVINAKLAAYLGHTTPPILTSHTQTLLVRDSVRAEIHSAAKQQVYLDFLTYAEPLTEAPISDTNLQFAFYINTNLQVVIWHRNMTGSPSTNEWLMLTNSPLINTSCWNRFTVAQDYTNHMFQLRVNEGFAIEDPAGWSQGGITRTGSWFHMVQTNNMMSRFIVSGVGASYLDDLTVRTSLSPYFGVCSGSVYILR